MSNVLKGAPNAPWQMSEEGQGLLLDLTAAVYGTAEQTTISIYPDKSTESGYSFAPVDPDRKRRAAAYIASIEGGTGLAEFVTAKLYWDELLPHTDDAQPDEELLERMHEAVEERLAAEQGAHPIEAKWITHAAFGVIVEQRQLSAGA